MITRRLGPADYPAVNTLFSVAFETAPGNGPAREGDEKIRHWGTFTQDGELMSSLSVTPFMMNFDGAACPMAGVGAVQTLPPYRRKGGVAACFAAALPALYSDGFLFSYLYPFSTAFYRRFGYESCVTKLDCTLDLQQLKLPSGESAFRLAATGPAFAEDIRSVDRRWERMWNMEVIRGAEDYSWLEKLDPYVSREYLYVCYDSFGAPSAYTTFRTSVEAQGRELVCSRFRFVDKAGFYSLLRVFKSLSADHRFARFTLPSDPALPYLTDEWSLGAAAFALRPSGMARVINVKEVLAHARYRGDGELRLAVRDALLPENNGVFSLRFTDGLAVSVERTEEKPDAVMGIAAFSALVAGVCDLDSAASWMDGVEIREPNAPLSALFFRKSMNITEYF